jgi:hypothetical protein
MVVEGLVVCVRIHHFLLLKQLTLSLWEQEGQVTLVQMAVRHPSGHCCQQVEEEKEPVMVLAILVVQEAEQAVILDFVVLEVPEPQVKGMQAEAVHQGVVGAEVVPVEQEVLAQVPMGVPAAMA